MFGFKFKLIAFLVGFGLILVVGSVLTNQKMLKSSLIDYVELRDQETLERIKNNVVFVLEEQLEDDIYFIDEITWKKIVDIAARVDFSETFVPVDIFLEYPYSSFRERHPDFVEKRVSLLDVDKNCIHGLTSDQSTRLTPIYAFQNLVGYIGYRPRSELTEQFDIELAERQNTLITYGFLIVLMVSGLLLIPFGHYFLKPIENVTKGMRRLSSGDFAVRQKVCRKDELGQLQQDFNQLAISLEKNLDSRNQWIADISHELRTPLTILRGDIEALKDGVRAFSAENLDNLHQEVLHLNRLVEDLYQIALNDVGGLRYQMQHLEFKDLLKQVCDAFAPSFAQKGLDFDLQLGKNSCTLYGDRDRLQQMLTNILSNSLAYTDQPGLVRVSLVNQGNFLELTLEDSSPGLSENGLEKLFDRFYRAESSRNRRLGGAGIGLTLVAQIVQAHQGEIVGEPSELGGLRITIKLPLEVFSV